MNYLCVACKAENGKSRSPDGICLAESDLDGLPSRCSGPWAEDKLFFVSRYCDIFSNGMKKKWQKRVFIDLFCGPGRCRSRSDGRFVDGSPLIALRYNFTHYCFGDLSSACLATLDQRIKMTGSSKPKLFLGDANDTVDEVETYLQSLGVGLLGLAFLDPQGIELKFSTLRKLTNNRRLDLLITLPLQMNIKRQIHYRVQDPANFDAYFGTTDWRELADLGSKTVRQAGSELLKLYKDQLRGLEYSYVYQKVIKDNNRPLYLLIFASKHSRGEAFWQEVTRIERSGQKDLFS
jgi:three-Cys-motif partner protein